MSSRRQKIDLVELVKDSPFEEPFKLAKSSNSTKSRCVRPCVHFISKDSSNFHKHLVFHHSNEYNDLCRQKGFVPKTKADFEKQTTTVPLPTTTPVAQAPIANFDQGVPMDIDNEDVSNVSSEVLLDISEEDDDDYSEEEEGNAHLLQVVQNNFADNSRYFSRLHSTFSEQHLNYARRFFRTIVTDRFVKNIPFSTTQRLFLDSLTWQLENPELSPSMSNLIEQVKIFASSDALQQVFLKQSGYLIEPVDLTVNGKCIGQRISLIELSRAILSNHSIVQSILKENNIAHVPISKFEKYNSELTCNESRRKRIIGKLRIQINGDDFTITRMNRGNMHKYYAMYVTFTNIPPKERLKREFIFLLAIFNRSKMKDDDPTKIVTFSDAVVPLFNELRLLEEEGIEVAIVDNNGTETKHNIKGVLSAFSCDNPALNEFLGLNICWYNGYMCRVCGASHKEIQDPSLLLKAMLGTPADEDKYREILAKRATYRTKADFKQKNEFGVKNECIFTKLSGVNIWNVAPSDVLHDIALGILPRIFEEFVFRYAINLQPSEITARINSFPFINGLIRLKYSVNSTSKKGAFTLKCPKAVQKLELLARFHEVFYGQLNTSNLCQAYQLLKHLKQLAYLSFSFSIDSEDLPKIRDSAKSLLDNCRSIFWNEEIDNEESDTDDDDEEPKPEPKYNVVPKLHQVQHYFEQVQFYGPLVQYSTLKFERKHQVFKQKADILKNFRNPSKSFAIHHQLGLAVKLSHPPFAEIDFFEKSTATSSTRQANLLLSSLQNATVLHSAEHPHRLNKNLAFKINHLRCKYWIHPVKYHKVKSDETIYAEGNIYEEKKQIPSLSSSLKEQFSFLSIKFPVTKFVNLDHLNYRSDFIFNHEDFGEFVGLSKGLI